jgi:hypothetical protein
MKKHYNTAIMLSVLFIVTVNAKCHAQACCDERHYAECHYAECRYAKCHYAECRYAKCHYAEC